LGFHLTQYAAEESGNPLENRIEFPVFSSVEVHQDEFGWRVWEGQPQAMHAPHQHSEIEINLLLSGMAEYLFGGHTATLEAGGWIIFWGALPHRLIKVEPRTRFLWLTLPLSDFLRFGLLPSLTEPVLEGQLVRVQGKDDLKLFCQWLLDWQGGEETQEILKLELEARLRRLALSLRAQPKRNKTSKHTHKAVQMAQFIVKHYSESLNIPEVAASVGLNPNYASSLFKQTFGMTVLQYLTQHRLAHAQRLLATTDMPILSIAFEAGFGSSSRFYATFEAATGQSPMDFRRGVQRRQ
jgi:AraC family transcriptional regulator, melibiose operon regulatory protein